MNLPLSRRRFMLATSALGLAATLAPRASQAAEPEKTDRELIAGTWLLARIGSNGAEKKPGENDSITLTVENETFKAIVVRDGDTLDVVGSYSLLDKETPKVLDLVVQNGDKGMAVYCLYELEKNVFRVRFNASTGERPPDLTTQVEGGMTLIFHRKK